MGNSHPSGGKTLLAERSFRDRAFDVKSWLEQRDPGTRGEGARNEFAALVPSKITPRTFARPGFSSPSAGAPVPIDILTPRSGIALSKAWRDRVPGSTFEIAFPFSGLTQRIANQFVIRRSSDVEQWKHIPRKAESGTRPFL